jgi:sigma-B regulation protein RsbU (phosphoserine phosphatase)
MRRETGEKAFRTVGEASSPVTLPETGAMATPSLESHAMQCMELIGGNRIARRILSAPRLDVWLESRPFKGDAGGDVHYFSICGSGRVVRLVIADVAGHGRSADQTALWLRGLMRKHINLLDQTGFARAINREFTAGAHESTFATALLMTYYAPTDHLIVCNAGHPRPLWYDSRFKRWKWLDPNVPDPGPSIREAKGTYRMRPVRNLPLGVLEPMAYQQFAVKLSEQDLVLVYTDGLTEARNRSDELLGEDGLLRFVHEIAPSAPERIGAELLQKIDRWRDGQPSDDDQTLIVLRQNGGERPRPTVRSALRVMTRLLGLKEI